MVFLHKGCEYGMASAMNKKTKVLVIILVSLLVTSVLALGGRMLYLKYLKPEDSVTVSNNQIGEGNLLSPETNTNISADNGSGNGENGNGTAQTQAAAPLLEFFKGQPDCNRKFEVRNMVPGDIEIRYFCLRAYHTKPVTLVFESIVTEQTKNLGDVLDVVVTNSQTGEVIAEGTFNEINGTKFSRYLPATDAEYDTAFYKIQVSMDTSVGNEYQVARLLADFHWYIEEGDEALDPSPGTGDSVNIMLWGTIIGVSLLLFILLFVTRRKEEEENDQQ